jgi:starvation-inducible DNA-binding protein
MRQLQLIAHGDPSNVIELNTVSEPALGREDVLISNVSDPAQPLESPGSRFDYQLSRLLDAHQTIIRQTRKLARRAVELGDDGSNDLLVSEMLRTNELQVWFLSEHLVDVPLITATA